MQQFSHVKELSLLLW